MPNTDFCSHVSSEIPEGSTCDLDGTKDYTVVPHARVGGLNIAVISREGLAQVCIQDWQKNRKAGYSYYPRLIFTANGQSVSMYHRDSSFRQLVNESDLVHADGMSVVFAGRIIAKASFPERVATSDFFHDIARKASDAGLGFYLLGGTEEINRISCEEIRKIYPHLKIVGRHHGYFDESEERKIIAAILQSKADVVWVALGRPEQEKWCVKYRQALRGVTWLKTCGGLLDFLSGKQKRAPLFMQRAGLEWFFRLIMEPRRLLLRYLLTNLHSIYCYLTKT